MFFASCFFDWLGFGFGFGFVFLGSTHISSIKFLKSEAQAQAGGVNLKVLPLAVAKFGNPGLLPFWG